MTPLIIAQIALTILGAGLLALLLLSLKKLLNPTLEKWEARRLAELERDKERYQRWLDDAPAREACEKERMEREKARLAALPPEEPTSGLNAGGWVLLMLGACLLLYFLTIYDASVQAGSLRVVNAARLQDRFIGIIISVVIAFSGGLCLIADQLRPKAGAMKQTPPADESHAQA